MSEDSPKRGHDIRRLTIVADAQVRELAELLIDCVAGGASVSFMEPLSFHKACEFWGDVAAGVVRGERVLLVAQDSLGISGTVQLIFAQPENQPHRADLSKMLVHRRARRRGVGAALLRAAEQVACECGKFLLVLDTASGDAERLYSALGWQRVGVIPGYASWPRGGLCDTTIFYRELARAAHPQRTPASTTATGTILTPCASDEASETAPIK